MSQDFFPPAPPNNAQPEHDDDYYNGEISKMNETHKTDCENSYNLNPNKIDDKATFNDLPAQKKYDYLVGCLEDKTSIPNLLKAGKRRSRKRNQKKTKKNHKKRNSRKSRRHRR